MSVQMLAIVNKDIFKNKIEKQDYGPGDTLDSWRKYESDHPRLDELRNGSRLFLVCVPPQTKHLWLVAVYESIKRNERGYPQSTRKNRTPITDITHLRDKLRFDNGIGIKWRGGVMAQSLQTPRILTEDDVRLLEQAIRKQTRHVLPPLRAPSEELSISIPRGSSKADKERLRAQCSRLIRDQALRPKVIELWGPSCAACGLELCSVDGAFEVEVAHIRPVSEDGPDWPTNTLPLCRTHHWAFDRHLFSVDPATLRLQVAPSLRKTPALATLHGRSLRRIPKRIEREAITQALRDHFQKFRRTHRRGASAELHPAPLARRSTLL